MNTSLYSHNWWWCYSAYANLAVRLISWIHILVELISLTILAAEVNLCKIFEESWGIFPYLAPRKRAIQKMTPPWMWICPWNQFIIEESCCQAQPKSSAGLSLALFPVCWATRPDRPDPTWRVVWGQNEVTWLIYPRLTIGYDIF